MELEDSPEAGATEPADSSESAVMESDDPPESTGQQDQALSATTRQNTRYRLREGTVQPDRLMW